MEAKNTAFQSTEKLQREKLQRDLAYMDWFFNKLWSDYSAWPDWTKPGTLEAMAFKEAWKYYEYLGRTVRPVPTVRPMIVWFDDWI